MIGGTVREAARRFRDAPAIVAPDGWSVSYLDLYRRTDEVAAWLHDRGIGPGGVVALSMPSSPDYVVAYLAAAKVGAITAGINPRYSPAERATILDRLEPDLALATAELASEGGVEVELADDAEGLGAGIRIPGDAPARMRPVSERPVAICFTSGTTGEPKGAVFTNRQLAAIAYIDAGARWGGGGPMLASTELVHVGFMTKLPWYLRLGNRIHLLRRWRAADALDVVARERITTVGGIPAQIALMMRLDDFDRYDLDHVERLVVGGAPSPPPLVRDAMDAFGASYSIRYSSTESGGVGCAQEVTPDDLDGIDTVGRPRPGVSVDVRDGEVWLRSNAVMAGYWRDPEATRETLVDGWLRTGDVGSLDEEGRLRLAGREKETYIRGGYNVHPQEVEVVLREHPKVSDVAIVPKPDEVMGQIGVAVVVPHDDPPSLDELRGFAERRLARYKLPEAIRITDALPLTPMHKVDRARLADEVGS